MTRHPGNNQQGFTITELLIALSIIGVLVAIAVPSYTSYISDSQQIDGREDVYRIMAQQERYFLKNMNYANTLAQIGYTVPVISPGGYFVMSTAACSDTTTQAAGACTRIVATGQGAQTNTTLWLESDGDKSSNL